jgi:hypothetical protein
MLGIRASILFASLNSLLRYLLQDFVISMKYVDVRTGEAFIIIGSFTVASNLMKVSGIFVGSTDELCLYGRRY